MFLFKSGDGNCREDSHLISPKSPRGFAKKTIWGQLCRGCKTLTSMDLIGIGGEAARTNAAEVLTKPVHSPSGVQRDLHSEARSAEFDGVGWMGWDGWDGMGRKVKWVLQFSSYFVSI